LSTRWAQAAAAAVASASRSADCSAAAAWSAFSYLHKRAGLDRREPRLRAELRRRDGRGLFFQQSGGCGRELGVARRGERAALRAQLRRFRFQSRLERAVAAPSEEPQRRQ